MWKSCFLDFHIDVSFHQASRFFLFGSFSFFAEKISFHKALYATFGAQGELRVAGFVDDFEAAALDLEV